MSFNTPEQIAQAAVDTGTKRAFLTPDKMLVGGFLAVKTGVVGTPKSPAGTPPALIFERLKAIATLKAVTETDWQIFLRALGCNWLVCLAVWLALSANDTGGKILGIFFPILAFVAIGFDHVVANMFFLPAAIFADVPGIGWADVLNNWLWAFLGNLVGAAVFVSTAYWFMYLRGTPDEGAAGNERAGQPGAESRLAPARRR